MAENLNQENDEITVTLTLEDDSELECVVLTTLEAAGRQYMALLPITEEGEDEEGEVYLYRYTQSADGLPVLENIETDEEYDAAAEAFDSWLDDQEYDELMTEEE